MSLALHLINSVQYASHSTIAFQQYKNTVARTAENAMVQKHEGVNDRDKALHGYVQASRRYDRA